MEYLTTIGTFLGGLGLLLCSFGIFWFASLYAKANNINEE